MFRVVMNLNKRDLKALAKYKGTEFVICMFSDEMGRCEHWRELSKKAKSREDKQRLYAKAINNASNISRMVSNILSLYRHTHD